MPPYLAHQTCCGQSPHRLVVGNERLQKKSALTRGDSDGDPPTVKSERRLGNSRKESRSSARESERAREEEFRGFERNLFQHCCLPHFIVERGMMPSFMAQTMRELSNRRRLSELPRTVKSPWVVKSLGLIYVFGRTMPQGDYAARPCQDSNLQ